MQFNGDIPSTVDEKGQDGASTGVEKISDGGVSEV